MTSEDLLHQCDSRLGNDIREPKQPTVGYAFNEHKRTEVCIDRR
jgi:hypothetical protein